MSIRTDFDSPFVDSSIVVASFVAGRERLFPSIAFTRKPITPEETEELFKASASLEGASFLAHCRSYICKYVESWCYSKSASFVAMSPESAAKLKHPVAVALYNVAVGFVASDEIPADWNWPGHVISSDTPEAIAGK
jgi:hypothetical protein